MLDAAAGVMWGVLLGDALGRPYEGWPRDALPDLHVALRQRMTSPRAWSHSDDGEMMLLLTASVVQHRTLHPRALLESMARNHEVARGYGRGTRAVFRHFLDTGDLFAAARAFWPEGSWGNGAVARAAPLAVLAQSEDAARQQAMASASSTHIHPHAMEGAALLSVVIHRALRGVSGNALIPESTASRFQTALQTMPPPDAPPATVARLLGTEVSALQSVPAALWAGIFADSFQDALWRAVSLGGDTDTIGAMTGAIAGARFGACNIPSAWILALEKPAQRMVNRLAPELAALTVMGTDQVR